MQLVHMTTAVTSNGATVATSQLSYDQQTTVQALADLHADTTGLLPAVTGDDAASNDDLYVDFGANVLGVSGAELSAEQAAAVAEQQQALLADLEAATAAGDAQGNGDITQQQLMMMGPGGVDQSGSVVADGTVSGQAIAPVTTEGMEGAYTYITAGSAVGNTTSLLQQVAAQSGIIDVTADLQHQPMMDTQQQAMTGQHLVSDGACYVQQGDAGGGVTGANVASDLIHSADGGTKQQQLLLQQQQQQHDMYALQDIENLEERLLRQQHAPSGGDVTGMDSAYTNTA